MAFLLALFVASCSTQVSESSGPGAGEQPGDPTGTGSTPVAEDPRVVPVYPVEILATHSHDRGSYTQGLVFVDGHLFESTGRRGKSKVRKWLPETGQVVLDHDLAYNLFGEGLAAYKGVLVQLTWESGQAIVYDRRSLAEVNRFSYEGEGWGLTFDGEHMIMSNGSNVLIYRDPMTFEEVRRLSVTFWRSDLGRYVDLYDLNELEYIDGEIWANVYQDERIVRIDPESGKVKSIVDLTGFQSKQGVQDPRQDVLNGIAHDAEGGRLYVTGKHWPNLYQIRVLDGSD